MDDRTTQLSICIEEFYRDWKRCSDACHIFPASHKDYVSCMQHCGDKLRGGQEKCIPKLPSSRKELPELVESSLDI
jgi:hypothetical protein